MNKSHLRDSVLAKLEAELELVTRAARMAHDEATHEESKPENKYDMHAQEAAYLAEGQARLAKELAENVQLFAAMPVAEWIPGTPAGIGAVITVENGGRRTVYLLGPRNGGLEVEVDGTVVTVVTPSSPLGRQLLGASLNGTVHLPGRGGTVGHRIAAIE